MPTDDPRSTLLACKLFSKWSKPTRTQRDSCVVHALCAETTDYSDWGTLHLQLIKNVFMANYVLWTRHGERGVLMEENEDEEEDNNIPDWAAGQAFTDTLMEDADEEEIPEDGHVDDLGQVLKDAQRDYENYNEKAKLRRMIEDHRKLLYQIANRITKSLVLHLKCCNGRQNMLCLIKHLRGC
jgi:hypothetical protein